MIDFYVCYKMLIPSILSAMSIVCLIELQMFILFNILFYTVSYAQTCSPSFKSISFSK